MPRSSGEISDIVERTDYGGLRCFAKKREVQPKKNLHDGLGGRLNGDAVRGGEIGPINLAKRAGKVGT